MQPQNAPLNSSCSCLSSLHVGVRLQFQFDQTTLLIPHSTFLVCSFYTYHSNQVYHLFYLRNHFLSVQVASPWNFQWSPEKCVFKWRACCAKGPVVFLLYWFHTLTVTVWPARPQGIPTDRHTAQHVQQEPPVKRQSLRRTTKSFACQFCSSYDYLWKQTASY